MSDLRTDPVLARWPGLETSLAEVRARRARDEATTAALRAYLEAPVEREVDVLL